MCIRDRYYDSTAYDNAEDTMPTLGSDNGLTLADLTGKAYDDPMSVSYTHLDVYKRQDTDLWQM